MHIHKNSVKECDGTHSECCARRVPHSEEIARHIERRTLAGTQPYGYRVVSYRVDTTARNHWEHLPKANVRKYKFILNIPKYHNIFQLAPFFFF
jgi:hypothetical protein